MNSRSCLNLTLSESDIGFVRSVGFYKYYVRILSETNNLGDFAKILKRFSARLEYDLMGYTHLLNEAVSSEKIAQKTIFTLPLEGSVFDQKQRNQLQGYIESVWQDPLHQLLVKWKEPDVSIFKFIFDLTRPGDRSFVKIKRKEIHLFPLVRNRSVAHEIGHVLGFQDHYYTQWDETTCEYPVESNDADLMSESGGSPTDVEWKKLIEMYPSKN